MPVAESSNTPLRQAIMIGLGVAATIGVVVYLLNSISSAGNNTVQLDANSAVINLGDAFEQAEQITEFGPSLWPLNAGRTTIYLSHVGDTPGTGWYAFSHISPEDQECVITPTKDYTQFEDECTSTTYSLKGEGLEQFAVTVNQNNQIEVDLETLS